MSRKLAAAVGAAVLTASIGAAVPGPALAGDEPPSRWVLRDGPGDVLAGEYPYKNVVRVNRPTVDITRAVVRHGPRAVAVRIRFVDLRRVKRPYNIHWYNIFFGLPRDGRPPFRPWLDLEATPKHQGGRVISFEDFNNALIRCPRLTHNINYATDVVTIRVPRRCLGTPAWVRVHIENRLFRRSLTGLEFQDSAHDRDYNFGVVNGGRGVLTTPRLSPP